MSHVDVVNNSIDLRNLGRGEGDHVSLLSRYGNGELTVANGSLDLGEEKRKILNLLDLLVVGDLLVVLPYASISLSEAYGA